MLTKIGEMADKSAANKDLVTYIKKEFYIPETLHDPKLKGRMNLMQYQEDALREALTPDENGNFKYSIIVWSDIKKSWKSTIAAAVNYARAKHTEYGEFYVVANDIKQADSRVAHYLRRAVQLNPKDKDVRTPGYKIHMGSGSFIEAIPIDPSGEAGSNADMITFSELWGANEEAKKNMWAEMTIPPGKRGKAFRWVESYAGFSGQAELLYSLYELGVKQGEPLWPDRLYPVNDSAPAPLELFVNKRAGMLCLWNTKPRTLSQTKEYYSEESSILTPNQFNRMHRNQWVSPTETFVPMEWILACKHSEEDWPKWESDEADRITDRTPFTKKRWPMVIALDAAVSDDTFALFMGCRHPTRHSEVVTMYCQIWKPPLNGKIDFLGTDDKPGPEKVLRRLMKEYNVVQVAYDSYQLHDFCSRLYQEGLAWFRPFPQGNDRLMADSQLRDIIRDRRFWHRGEADFIEHANNADAQIDPEDRKIRIVKRAERLKIDAVVAASMCSYQVLHLNLV